MGEDRGNQAQQMAHLRPLPRCHCGKPATEAVYTGLNDLYGVYCLRHAKQALADYRRL
jgi:hypothetical protein